MREVNYDERWKVARDLACKINLWPTVENLRHLDAALRRAKAEGLRLSKHEYQCWEDAMWSAETKDVVTFGRWIDARAAQIEEGE